MEMKTGNKPRGLTSYDEYSDVFCDFYGWVENAGNAALFAARSRAADQLNEVKDIPLKKQIKRMISIINNELATRDDLAVMEQRRKHHASRDVYQSPSIVAAL